MKDIVIKGWLRYILVATDVINVRTQQMGWLGTTALISNYLLGYYRHRLDSSDPRWYLYTVAAAPLLIGMQKYWRLPPVSSCILATLFHWSWIDLDTNNNHNDTVYSIDSIL